MEWILIATLALSTSSHSVRDVSPFVLPGFTSQSSCERAAQQLSERLEKLVHATRRQQGIPPNSAISKPQILTDCVMVQK
jgi:hypothetical protein